MLTEYLDGGGSPGAYVGEAIYGANDGIVTTFAVVAGVAGASLDPAIVVILGVANLLADGVSMGLSNFLSRRSEIAYAAAQGEVHADQKPPGLTALATFLAFVVAGWAPLLPYIFTVEPLFQLSIFVTGLAFFAAGASRVVVTDSSWLRSGLEMLVVGMLAASVAFAVGTILQGLA